MSTQESTASDAPPNMTLLWGCFVALITTSFAFISRAFLVNDPNLWPKEFILPISMLVAYLSLIVRFRSRGGYKPVHLDASP